MISASSQNLKAKSGGRCRVSSEGRDGVEATNASAEQSVKRGLRKVSKNQKSTQTVDTDATMSNQSSLPINTASSPMMHGNIAISGGNFVQNGNVVHIKNSGRSKAFKLLQQRVAPAAFHNSAQRIYPPKCHPNTRIAVIQTIYDWFMQSEDREQWLLWLNGAAGAGKSAIMQSLAERCTQEAMAIASFFFFKADPTRNTMAPLIATLTYQLIQAIPETEEVILPTIERNPLIFDQSLESQLQQLLIQPLRRLPRHLQRLFVVFLDGLDECSDQLSQSHLIKILGDVSCGKDISAIFLVSARREPQIEAAFAQKPGADLLRTLLLDEISASDDIKRFLEKEFENIKETHLLKSLLPNDWPTTTVIEEIVEKSSSQFIFASVVINYVSSPRANPSTRLEFIRGLRVRDPSSQNPFAHLDALYQEILSHVEEPNKVFDIIAFTLLSYGDSIDYIEQVFLLEKGDVHVLFADLNAIILCESYTKILNPRLKYLHASLRDFLLDKSRSGQYHIDLDEYKTKLLCMFLARTPPLLDQRLKVSNLIRRERGRLDVIKRLLEEAKASEQLHSVLMKFNSTFYTYTEGVYGPPYIIIIDILKVLKRLNFNDEDKVYCHVKNVFATECTKYWSSLPNQLQHSSQQESLDLSSRMIQIQEEAQYQNLFYRLFTSKLPIIH